MAALLKLVTVLIVAFILIEASLAEDKTTKKTTVKPTTKPVTTKKPTGTTPKGTTAKTTEKKTTGKTTPKPGGAGDAADAHPDPAAEDSENAHPDPPPESSTDSENAHPDPTVEPVGSGAPDDYDSANAHPDPAKTESAPLPDDSANAHPDYPPETTPDANDANAVVQEASQAPDANPDDNSITPSPDNSGQSPDNGGQFSDQPFGVVGDKRPPDNAIKQAVHDLELPIWTKACDLLDYVGCDKNPHTAIKCTFQQEQPLIGGSKLMVGFVFAGKQFVAELWRDNKGTVSLTAVYGPFGADPDADPNKSKTPSHADGHSETMADLPPSPGGVGPKQPTTTKIEDFIKGLAMDIMKQACGMKTWGGCKADTDTTITVNGYQKQVLGHGVKKYFVCIHFGGKKWTVEIVKTKPGKPTIEHIRGPFVDDHENSPLNPNLEPGSGGPGSGGPGSGSGTDETGFGPKKPVDNDIDILVAILEPEIKGMANAQLPKKDIPKPPNDKLKVETYREKGQGGVTYIVTLTYGGQKYKVKIYEDPKEDSLKVICVDGPFPGSGSPSGPGGDGDPNGPGGDNGPGQRPPLNSDEENRPGQTTKRPFREPSPGGNDPGDNSPGNIGPGNNDPGDNNGPGGDLGPGDGGPVDNGPGGDNRPGGHNPGVDPGAPKIRPPKQVLIIGGFTPIMAPDLKIRKLVTKVGRGIVSTCCALVQAADCGDLSSLKIRGYKKLDVVGTNYFVTIAYKRREFVVLIHENEARNSLELVNIKGPFRQATENIFVK